MSKLESIIALEKQVIDSLDKAKSDVLLIMEEKRRLAEIEISKLKSDYDSKLDKVNIEAKKDTNVIQESLESEKLQLNKKIETDFKSIVDEYTKKLINEVTKS